MLGAFTAIGVSLIFVKYPVGAPVAGNLASGVPQWVGSLIAEAIGTFALVTVVLHVAALQDDNSFFGLAIAAIVGGGKPFLFLFNTWLHLVFLKLATT